MLGWAKREAVKRIFPQIHANGSYIRKRFVVDVIEFLFLPLSLNIYFFSIESTMFIVIAIAGSHNTELFQSNQLTVVYEYKCLNA